MGGIGLELPGGSYVPAEHESVGGFIRQHASPSAFAAVFGAIDDVTTDPGLERRGDDG
jgi:hypothetical protein